MPSLKEIKGRIASVKSTRKITSAMKMVASSKLHHAQVAIQNMLPYETMLEHILKSFLAAEAEAQTISNSSLCGGFNANVIKLMQRTVEAYTEELGQGSVEVYAVGRKVNEKARKLGYDVKGEYASLIDHPSVQPCIDMAMELGKKFMDGEIDCVELIYHHFKSAGSQILTRKTFLPIDIESELDRDHERDLTTNIVTKKAQDYLKKNRRKKEAENEEVKPLNDNFIVEPDMDTHTPLPQFLRIGFNGTLHQFDDVGIEAATE